MRSLGRFFGYGLTPSQTPSPAVAPAPAGALANVNGITNIGNTCYAAALLQILFHLAVVREVGKWPEALGREAGFVWLTTRLPSSPAHLNPSWSAPTLVTRRSSLLSRLSSRRYALLVLHPSVFAVSRNTYCLPRASCLMCLQMLTATKPVSPRALFEALDPLLKSAGFQMGSQQDLTVRLCALGPSAVLLSVSWAFSSSA